MREESRAGRLPAPQCLSLPVFTSTARPGKGGPVTVSPVTVSTSAITVTGPRRRGAVAGSLSPQPGLARRPRGDGSGPVVVRGLRGGDARYGGARPPPPRSGSNSSLATLRGVGGSGAWWPVWVRGLCHPSGEGSVSLSLWFPASGAEVEQRHYEEAPVGLKWQIHVCVTTPPCPKTQQVRLIMWQLCQFYFFF